MGAVLMLTSISFSQSNVNTQNEIIINEEADMVAMARAFLTNPRWVWDAAKTLKINIEVPPQYARRF